MVVVSGSNARPMAEQLAGELGWSHHSIETRRFPDTEGYIRIPDELIDSIREEPVVLVSNTFPDSGIIETLLMLEAINDVAVGFSMAEGEKCARCWKISREVSVARDICDRCNNAVAKLA